MFRFSAWMVGLWALVTATAPAAAADLGKIDWTIRKEPVYQARPGYGLLVFGTKAWTRVWVVQDGQALSVDRNGDGNLAGKDERVRINAPDRAGKSSAI
jgi:hypothetical protein